MIVRDKDTKQSKGLAYVTFADPMDAAIAFEQCDQGIVSYLITPRLVNFSLLFFIPSLFECLTLILYQEVEITVPLGKAP